MNRNLFFALLLLAGIWVPLDARADESASTTPEIVEPAPVVAPATPVAVPEDVPAVETASTTEPVATSTEPRTPTDPSPSHPPSVPITLALETQDGTLFSGLLTVTACAAIPDAPITVNGFCAVEQSGVPAAWNWYGSDAFIDTIGGVGNDYTKGVYWNWFSDLTYGMTSLNAHVLHPNESLVISIGRLPLRVTATPEEAVVGSTTTIAVSAFAFDSNFEPVWVPAASSTVHVNGVPYLASTEGVVSYVPLESGELTVTATKDGFLPATQISIPINKAPNPAPGTGGESDTEQPGDAVDLALEFLRAHQHPDGSFASPLLSDWAAIAFASANAPSRSLRQYLISTSDPLESATDFERRAMALAAIGINPQKEIGEIVERFDGTQVGERALLNDDIFALIALAHGGYTSSDPLIKQLAAALVESQQENGAWISTDLTAAGVQALAPLSSLPGVSGAIAKARTYLASRIDTNGCFGNSFVTSWGIMAIHALGESPDAWTSSSGATPLSCLKTNQASDGGFEEGASTDTRVWATAYAIPALSGETWSDILRRYPKPESSTDEARNAEETETLPEEVEVVALVATTTLSLLTEPVVAEMAPAQASVPARETDTAEEIVLPIPHIALAASALAAIEPESAAASEESLWSFLVDVVKSILALVFQPGAWS